MPRTRQPKRARGGSSSTPQAENEESTFDTSLLRDLTRAAQWKEFKTRPILTGRIVELRPKYHHLLNGHLQRMGWEGLLNITPKVYPQLVRYFYTNLIIIDNDQGLTLASYVNGVAIFLSVSRLAEILGIPVGGSQVYFSKSNDLRVMVDNVADFYETLTGDKEFRGTISAKDLHRKHLLLNRFLCENVIPRGGHFDEITPFQSYLLHQILTKGSLSLPYIMIKEMESATRSDKKSLPFGGLLTKVFEDYHVPVLDEVEGKMQPPIDKSTISKMNLENIENPYVTREGAQSQGENVIVTGGVAHIQGEQHSMGFSRFSSMAARNDIGPSQLSLQDVYHRLTALEQQFSQFRSETQSSLDALHGKMDQVLHYLLHNLPPAPPPHP